MIEGLNLYTITRIEVIDDTGRIFIKYLSKKDQKLIASVQDDDKTLKLFIKNKDENNN